MGVLTNLLKLLKPSENDYYNQQTEQADNWDKVDDYAVLTNTDKNGIWGGDFGGYIQDPIPKELNKRYIDNINGKAFICIKAGDSSVVSNTIEYFTPCNVVDNLDKLQNLSEVNRFINKGIQISKQGATVCINITGAAHSELVNFVIPEKYRPSTTVRFACFRYSPDEIGFYFVNTNGAITFTQAMNYIDTGNVSYQI